MPNFSVRYQVDMTCTAEADTVEAAAALVRAELRKKGLVYRVVAIWPEGQPFPGLEMGAHIATDKPTRKPPGKPSPSGGTPGTPVIRIEEQPDVIAAAA